MTSVIWTSSSSSSHPSSSSAPSSSSSSSSASSSRSRTHSMILTSVTGRQPMPEWHKLTPRNNPAHRLKELLPLRPIGASWAFLDDCALVSVMSCLPLQTILCIGQQICKHWTKYAKQRLSFINCWWTTKFIGDTVPRRDEGLMETKARLEGHWQLSGLNITKLHILLDENQRYPMHENAELASLHIAMIVSPPSFGNLREVYIVDVNNIHRHTEPFDTNILAFHNVRTATIVLSADKSMSNELVYHRLQHSNRQRNHLAFTHSMLQSLTVVDRQSQVMPNTIRELEVHARSLTSLAVRDGRERKATEWFTLASQLPLLESFTYADGHQYMARGTCDHLLAKLIRLPELRHIELFRSCAIEPDTDFFFSMEQRALYEKEMMARVSQLDWLPDIFEGCTKDEPGRVFDGVTMLELTSFNMKRIDKVRRLIECIVRLFPNVRHLSFNQYSSDINMDKPGEVASLFHLLPHLLSISFTFPSWQQSWRWEVDDPSLPFEMSMITPEAMASTNAELVALRPTYHEWERCYIQMYEVDDIHAKMPYQRPIVPFRHSVDAADFHDDCDHLAHVLRHITYYAGQPAEMEDWERMTDVNKQLWHRDGDGMPKVIICHKTRMPHCMQPMRNGPASIVAKNYSTSGGSVIDTNKRPKLQSIDDDDDIDKDPFEGVDYDEGL